MVLLATVPSGLLIFGILYFILGVWSPAQLRACAYFFSEISRLMFACDLGSGIGRASVRSEYLSHSTAGIWHSCCKIGPFVGLLIFCHTLCAGYHLISVVIPGLALHSIAI